MQTALAQTNSLGTTMADQNPKQQIVDKLRDVDTIMITVNSNPSVDELSAALGFTLLLNKINKHATAVFSGAIPPAITFLEPDKTFENTVNSLRDFIIALDKEKADHLRYKVDGDVVKIFITPYRTTITQDDLEFTQGDYNVEMVIALGVRDEGDLDRALSEHGKIMHDATVASLSIGTDSSELGSINWHESEASSYSEVLVSLAESLRSDKKLIDEQIATAFLTGIVAATDRFSNSQTTSKVMTMAAQLMAAGANQQLIATQLEEAREIPQQQATHIDQNSSSTVQTTPGVQADEPELDRQQADGSMAISHEKQGDVDEVASQIERDNQAAAAQQASSSLSVSHDDDDLDPEGVFQRQYGAQRPTAQAPSIEELRHDLEEAERDHSTQPVTTDHVGRTEMSLPSPSQQVEPTMGGTLSATASQASEDRRREEEADRNKQVLHHGAGSAQQYAAAPPADYPSLNSFDKGASSTGDDANTMPDFEPLTRETHTHAATVQPLSDSGDAGGEALPPMPAKPSFGDMGHDDARAAIESALQTGPSTADQHASLAAAEQNPSAFPPLPPVQAPQPPQQSIPPAQPSTAFPPMPPDEPGPELPPLPAMPDFSALPPIPGADTGQPSASPAGPQQVIAADPSVDLPPLPGSPSLPPIDSQPVPPSAQPNDPGQFQIPTSQP